ncbi:hypothetical protein SAMN05443544_1021 [Agromyces cerinus subsp. cerinus]|uniref:Uncharacterized protein n=1 Tax=Agromyces cerinus subsp. cerinus TaxID=232089 RepID=A0A1N6E2T9_9MICO|nr:hypothetical protein SAMN05443544_1021 [Agromyces cerinus subsp. cerinus]
MASESDRCHPVARGSDHCAGAVENRYSSGMHPAPSHPRTHSPTAAGRVALRFEERLRSRGNQFPLQHDLPSLRQVVSSQPTWFSLSIFWRDRRRMCDDTNSGTASAVATASADTRASRTVAPHAASLDDMGRLDPPDVPKGRATRRSIRHPRTWRQSRFRPRGSRAKGYPCFHPFRQREPKHSPPGSFGEDFVRLAAGDPLRRPSAVRSVGYVDGAAFAGVMSTGLFGMSILPQERQGPRPVHPERV